MKVLINSFTWALAVFLSLSVIAVTLGFPVTVTGNGSGAGAGAGAGDEALRIGDHRDFYQDRKRILSTLEQFEHLSIAKLEEIRSVQNRLLHIISKSNRNETQIQTGADADNEEFDTFSRLFQDGAYYFYRSYYYGFGLTYDLLRAFEFPAEPFDAVQSLYARADSEVVNHLLFSLEGSLSPDLPMEQTALVVTKSMDQAFKIMQYARDNIEIIVQIKDPTLVPSLQMINANIVFYMELAMKPTNDFLAPFLPQLHS